MSLEVTSIAFFGRTFDEYVRMFGLDPAGLTGRRIADVASGPSSFTAEARRRGLDAVGIDPLYGLPVETLALHVRNDYAAMFAAMRRKESAFRFRFFPSIDTAEASRRAAAERFLADYEAGFLHDRYVGAALPRLPFPEGAFDLVLCAHLLFIYSRRFDFAWHLRSCRELVRVSAGEVRIHPICGLDGRPYAGLDRLISELDREGIAAAIRPVDYEFFAGSDTTLVLAAHKQF